MTRYRTRPGVVLTEICGAYMLVSAKANLTLCPYVTEINGTSAFLWKRLVKGADELELLEAVKESYEIGEPEAALEAIRGFITSMLEMNYLLADEE